MHRRPPATACFAFPLAVALALIPALPVQAQGEPGRPGFRPIANAFARDAVTYDELVERAKDQPYVRHELIVALSLDTPKRHAADRLRSFDWRGLLGSHGVRLIAPLTAVERDGSRSVALAHLSLPEGLDVFTAMRSLQGNADVLWASPNFYQDGDPRDFVPNDPDYASQYHHPLMKNDLAWNVTLGSATVTIAVTDDGAPLTHTDLAPNLWVNPGEIPGNAVDDDGNGYVDDVNGWDFVSNNNDPNPNLASDTHGTLVTGVAAARTHNAIGVAGVSGRSRFMPLQFAASNQPWTSTNINAAFHYAVDMGAKIINTSYTLDGWVGNAVVTAALQYVHDAGVLHFSSGGNDNVANPVRQAFTQTLFVTNTTATDVKHSTSNYGSGMDIAAPGVSIRSTEGANGYGQSSGTSMASPNAAGAAALNWSMNPTWNSYQVACKLLASADNIDAQNPAYAGLLGSGRVNSWAALIDSLIAPRVKHLTSVPAESGNVASPDLLSFSVAFTQVMDRTTSSNIANYELLGAGPNGTFGDGDDVVQPLTMLVPYMLGENQLRFTIDNAPLACGAYRLTVRSGGVRNPFSTALDGNGDGAAGDHFVRTFQVTDIVHYVDSDMDGYGFGPGLATCPAPVGYSPVSGDCDDTNASIYPGVAESCNGVDDNCDGVTDFPAVSASTDVPVAIPNGIIAVTSTLSVSGLTGSITSVRVIDLLIHHTVVGQLRATLTAPGGTIITLFDRPGVPATASGCGENHLLATFDDGATLTAADFEATCNASPAIEPPPYAISGTYRPASSFADVLGSSPNGSWTLTVHDAVFSNTGSIRSWNLEVITTDTQTTYYADTDGDGYGDPAGGAVLGCQPGTGAGYVLDNTDCDDGAATTHPGASELCDGADNDCDTAIDEGDVCAVDVGEQDLPERFALKQPPNPFSGKSTIHFALPTKARVKLEVFDIAGRRVAELVNRHVSAGYRSVGFEAVGLAGGVYFCRMTATGDDETSHVQTRKFVLVR